MCLFETIGDRLGRSVLTYSSLSEVCGDGSVPGGWVARAASVLIVVSALSRAAAQPASRVRLHGRSGEQGQQDQDDWNGEHKHSLFPAAGVARGGGQDLACMVFCPRKGGGGEFF